MLLRQNQLRSKAKKVKKEPFSGATPMMEKERKCGACKACCVWMPVAELSKKTDEPCSHLKANKRGCSIYSRRPPGCYLWSCMWLIGAQSSAIARPDISGYFLDPMGDYVSLVFPARAIKRMEVTPLWSDPLRPDAWRTDEALLNWADSSRTVIQDNRTGTLAYPPSWTSGDQWHFKVGIAEPEHSTTDIIKTLRACRCQEPPLKA